MKYDLRDIVSVGLATIFLCFAAFNNKFPIVTGDSGLYMDMGFSKNVHQGHSFIYGLFLAHSSWHLTLWLPILTQGFFVAFLLSILFKFYFDNSNWRVYFIGFVLFLVFATTASYTISTVSPAIFIITGLLSLSILYLPIRLLSYQQYFIFFLLILGMCIDIVLLIEATVFIITVFCLKGLRKSKVQITPNTLRGLVVSLVVVWIITYSANYLIEFTNNSHQDQLIMVDSFSDYQTKLFDSFGRLQTVGFKSDHEVTPKSAIYKWYHDQFREYVISSQSWGELSITILNYSTLILVVVGVLGYLVIRNRENIEMTHFLFILLPIFLVCHPFCSAIFKLSPTISIGSVIWIMLLPIYIKFIPVINKVIHVNRSIV